MDDFDLDLLESLNLTGQYQASGLPVMNDPLLDNQILGGVFLSIEEPSVSPASNSHDDISNALIDSSRENFATFTSLLSQTPESPCETDDIVKLISSSIADLTQQSTIEELMESTTLHQSTTDASSLISFQIGSSPLEPKDIDNSILTRQTIRESQRNNKTTAKSKKSLKNPQSSSNVGPICILSTYGACEPCTTAQMEEDLDLLHLIQFDSFEPKCIQLLSQPRSKFRPRTLNETKYASHYIRCEANSSFEYPTISTPQVWGYQSMKNIIEVALVTVDGQPHPYTIANKMCDTSDINAPIFRQGDSNTLYFCVLNEDLKCGHKSFMIEYIKSKQDNVITKELIKTRQLEQSMLRFTRIYQNDKDSFERDETSTAYSCIMTETYGDVAVEHMGPTYGPLCGNERVYAILKGRIAKEDIRVFVTETQRSWHQQLPFVKNGNIVYFVMPAFPFSGIEEAVVNISLCYQSDEIYQSPYVYKGSLDQMLTRLNLNDSDTHAGNSSTLDLCELFSATGLSATRSSSRKASNTKSMKRLNKK